MKYHYVLLAIFFTTNAFCLEHSLSAHEHGSIKLGMAVEKNVLDIDLDGPTESFISFEYLPKTPNEKKVFNEAKDLWEKKLLTLITPDKSLNCKISEASFKQIIDEKETREAQAKIKDKQKKEAGVHSDIEAKAKITCSKILVGSDVQISLKKYFKNIKKLMADIISNNTVSIEITKPVQIIKI